MRPNDYFAVAEMQQHGPDVWERVRAKLRSEGHTIVKGYGEFNRQGGSYHYTFLSHNGNLVHSKDRPNGLKIDIAKYLGLNTVKPLKIRTGSDPEVVRQAFEYLVSLGFNDHNHKAILDTDKLLGLLADSDGVIYSILTLDGYVNKYAAVDEIEFDKEIKVIVSNFRPVRKTISIQGVTVYEDAFAQFLKDNAIKSAA